MGYLWTHLAWTSVCLMVLLGVASLRERHAVASALAAEQTWGFRGVAAALAFGFGINLLLSFFLSSPLPSLVHGSLWPVALFIVARQLAFLLPAGYIVLRASPRSLRSVGLHAGRAPSLMMGAIVSYFLIVVWWAIPRSFGSLDWTELYRNPLFGDLLSHIPLGSALGLVVVAALGGASEEVIFRGFALIPLARVATPVGGLVLTAFLWSAAHAQSIGRVLNVFLMGLILGWVFLRTGSLVPSLTFHVLWNLGSLSDVVFGRLARAGVQWTRQEHFVYIGLGSFGVAIIAGLVGILARPRQSPHPGRRGVNPRIH